MFADDTKIWTRISAAKDAESVQSDSDSLSRWSDEWSFQFNPEKYKVNRSCTYDIHLKHPTLSRQDSQDWSIQKVTEKRVGTR